MVLSVRRIPLPAEGIISECRRSQDNRKDTPEMKNASHWKRLALSNFGADGETRTRTAFATTPSR
ncbi:hypothetical protein EMIT0111MI5_150136 [Burkholderia sp. IT-111MI5]